MNTVHKNVTWHRRSTCVTVNKRWQHQPCEIIRVCYHSNSFDIQYNDWLLLFLHQHWVTNHQAVTLLSSLKLFFSIFFLYILNFTMLQPIVCLHFILDHTFFDENCLQTMWIISCLSFSHLYWNPLYWFSPYIIYMLVKTHFYSWNNLK